MSHPLPDQRWLIATNPEANLTSLGEQTGLSPLLVQVLLNRSIATPEKAKTYLEPETETLPSPLTEFPDLAPSVDLLLEAIANQDKIAVALLMERTNLKKYLTGLVADTQANLEKAALDVAMVWSSSGVPYNTLGRYQTVNKNQSYYHKSSGGGDKASVKTEKVQEALKASRKK